MPKKFSVVTINYNNLNGLKRTFRSIVCQTAREEIEFIVVDGNSNDGSALFLTDNSLLIDVLKIEEDKGIYDAMNQGLHLATGEYVWFVNSGDTIYDPHFVQKILTRMDSNPDVIYGDTMYLDLEGKDIGRMSKLKPQKLTGKLGPGSFRFGMNVCHQSFIARREMCPDFDLQYRQAADIDWIIKILKKKPTTYFYGDIIAGFEIGGSSSQNEKRALKERYQLLGRHYGVIPNLLAHGWIVIRRFLFKIGLW
ncbi:MAG: glycosyltransferase [Bacteroidetes bacterium]|nr:glycosyltransferase [Bacteroidota bacterium]